MELEHILTPLIKINSKWLQDLIIRHNTIKLLEESMGKTFSNINCTNIFLGQSPKGTEIQTEINKLNLIKLTSFCTEKETILKKRKKTKRQPTERGKILANYTIEKGLISRIYKQLIQLNNNKKPTAQSINGQKTLIDISPKKTYSRQ